MANIKSSKKRIGVAESKRIQNQAKTSAIKTNLKKFNSAVAAKDSAQAITCQGTCTSLIDKTMNKQKAARMKAKMAKDVQSIK